jgi:hypothetical protein
VIGLKTWRFGVIGVMLATLAVGCDAAASEPLQVDAPSNEQCQGATKVWAFPLYNFLSRPLEVAALLDNKVVANVTVPGKQGAIDPGKATVDVRQATPGGFESILQFSYSVRGKNNEVIRAGTAADRFRLKNTCLP